LTGDGHWQEQSFAVWKLDPDVPNETVEAAEDEYAVGAMLLC
jgi:hypothetical protein